MDCKICGRPTDRILIRKGTMYCCNICEKIADNDIDIQLALDYLWSINTTVAIATHDVIVQNLKEGVYGGEKI